MAAFDKKGQNERPYRSVSGVRPRDPSEAGQDGTAGEPGGAAWSPPAASAAQEACSDHKQAANLLGEAAQWMARVPHGPLRQELQQTLERYRRTLRDWEQRPPSDAQRAILLQGVQILRSAIARATRAG